MLWRFISILVTFSSMFQTELIKQLIVKRK